MELNIVEISGRIKRERADKEDIGQKKHTHGGGGNGLANVGKGQQSICRSLYILSVGGMGCKLQVLVHVSALFDRDTPGEKFANAMTTFKSPKTSA